MLKHTFRWSPSWHIMQSSSILLDLAIDEISGKMCFFYSTLHVKCLQSQKCTKSTHYLVNSVSTTLKVSFRRSCRFFSTFFVILFWCRVPLSHSTPKYTFTWHPFEFEGKSSIWYRMWSCKRCRETRWSEDIYKNYYLSRVLHKFHVIHTLK